MSDEARQERAADPPSPWSIGIGAVFGIPVRVHATFLLIVAFVAWSAAAAGQSIPANLLLVLLLFVCVVLHELGHALMARRFGVRTREIVLYPIGGIARLENIPGGRAEILIALAGPAVNLVLFLVLVAGFGAALPAGFADGQTLSPGASLLGNLAVANLWLFLFNLIPAFPMDGGRVLRAALSLRLGEARATRVAAGVAQVVALGFGAVGLFTGNPILLFIALFVFLGATQEAAFVERRAAVAGHRAREAMITRFETLAPQDTLGRAAEVLLASHQQDFPVLDAWERVAGVLPRSTLLKALAREGKDAAVLDVMHREPILVEPSDPLERVLAALQGSPGDPVLVLEQGRLVGMITLDNLAEFIEVAKAARPGIA
jgi:stage IV sporulation protein FB